MEHILLPALDWQTGEVATREMLEVEPLGANRYRLLHSPAFVDGIAAGDVIELDINKATGFTIIERGGNIAVVVAFPSEDVKSPTGVADLASVMGSLSGVCDGGPGTALVCSVPVSAGFAALERALVAFCTSHPGVEWWYGNVYSPTGEPLGWW